MFVFETHPIRTTFAVKKRVSYYEIVARDTLDDKLGTGIHYSFVK